MKNFTIIAYRLIQREVFFNHKFTPTVCSNSHRFGPFVLLFNGALFGEDQMCSYFFCFDHINDF